MTRTPCACETEPRLDRDAARAGAVAAVLAMWLGRLRAELTLPDNKPDPGIRSTGVQTEGIIA